MGTHDFPPKRRKKVDYEALHSPLKRIPSIDIATVRDLLDIGVRQTDDLRGRAPEALYEDILNLRPSTPEDRLWAIRMAVYFAEADSPDARLLYPWKWRD